VYTLYYSKVVHLNRTGNAIQRRPRGCVGRVCGDGRTALVRLCLIHASIIIIRLLLLFAFQPAHDIVITSHIDCIDAQTIHRGRVGTGCVYVISYNIAVTQVCMSSFERRKSYIILSLSLLGGTYIITVARKFDVLTRDGVAGVHRTYTMPTTVVHYNIIIMLARSGSPALHRKYISQHTPTHAPGSVVRQTRYRTSQSKRLVRTII